MNENQGNFKRKKRIHDILDERSSEEQLFPISDSVILDREKKLLNESGLHLQYADEIDENADWEQVLRKSRSFSVIDLRQYLKYAALLATPLLIAAVFFFKYNRPETKVSIAQTYQHQPKKKITLILQDGSNVDLRQAKTVKGLSGLVNQNSTLDYTKTTNTSSLDNPVFNTLVVPRGTDYKLVLEDGTEVWVNAETQIKYQVNMSKFNTREVYLESGEAYFQVAKNPDKPFIVHKGDMNVQVLGTSFNVNAYSNKFQTTLVEGKVKVNFAGAKQKLVLIPGQQANFERSTGNFEKQDVDVYPFVAWKEGVVVFQTMEMSELMEQIGRLYDYEIIFKDEALKQLHCTGRADKSESIDNILDIIQGTSNLKFTIQGRSIIVERSAKT
ncbi:hypothetical protein C3K47_04185 [Solitalea longa]|uniref:FecR family protein n=1 Tax=Solitalea longa TaxID=2079460 RepID=A0A2S5A7M1_9SPHI|nr:FecR domain-containing protein [Solitalea longa]POY38601.1 hypothetical protein C3K47_04185 [Solitalea longa]